MPDNIKTIVDLIKEETKHRIEGGHPTKYYNGVLYRVQMDISKEVIKIMERKRNDKWS